MRALPDALQRTVPTFKLYGEILPWATPEPLHSELISERSGRLDWHIPNHRHADLVHFVYLRSGALVLQLEAGRHALNGPALIVVPVMAIHGFDLEPGADGYSVAVHKTFLDELTPPGEPFERGRHHPLAGQPQAALLDSSFSLLHAEYSEPGVGRDAALQGLTQVLAVQIARLAGVGDTPQRACESKGHHHLQRFQKRVEQCFKQHLGIEALANELGITGTYLNQVCQRLTGSNALHILHERLMLEARRLLIYTTLTISQVADELGFDDPAYFTRFFKRHAGISPKLFRQKRHA